MEEAKGVGKETGAGVGRNEGVPRDVISLGHFIEQASGIADATGLGELVQESVPAMERV